LSLMMVAVAGCRPLTERPVASRIPPRNKQANHIAILCMILPANETLQPTTWIKP
jgi:hypothetical protein